MANETCDGCGETWPEGSPPEGINTVRYTQMLEGGGSEDGEKTFCSQACTQEFIDSID